MTARQVKASLRDQARCLIDLVARMGGRVGRAKHRPAGRRRWVRTVTFAFPDDFEPSAELYLSMGLLHKQLTDAVWDGECGPCGGPPDQASDSWTITGD